MFLQLSHFEKYNTKIMFLPWVYDFTMWGCSLALLIVFFFGPELYVKPVFGYSLTLWTEIFLYTTGMITHYPTVAWNIYK